MGIADWLRPRPALDAATRALVERAVDRVEPLIREVGGYQGKLAPAVRHALEYCEDIANRIPGPYEISRAAFTTTPLVRALFGSADDIEMMLARSWCVREHLVEFSLGTGECYALLGMRRREKVSFGAKLSGEVVRRDEPQKALYFVDHTLAEPSPDLEAARLRLRDMLFDGLLKSFAAHVADVRAERDSLHRDHAIVHACLRSGNDPENHTRRLADLEERLRATADALEPARLLDMLSEALARPETQLRLDPVRVVVDRTGIIVGTGEAGEAGEGDLLHFAELTNRDQRRWVVVFARIERDEARRAIERLEQANRHIVI